MRRFCTVLAILFVLSSNLYPNYPAIIPSKTVISPPSEASLKAARDENKKHIFSIL